MTARTKLTWSFVAAASLVFALAAPRLAGAVEVDSAFSDDNWSIHETAINAIAADGITKGCNPPANDKFCPTRSVTRGEMAAFIVRAFDLAGPDTAPFIDTVDHLFEADIAKIAAAGITVGCRATEFCPDRSVTRGEMATFLLRALDLTPVEDGPFVDTASTIHRPSINAIAAEGITKGCNPPTNDSYCPYNDVTRAQMATFLVRALDLPEILNRLVLVENASCNEEQTVCSSLISIPAGRSFTVTEGWYQVLPASVDEIAEFESATTAFTLSLDGDGVTGSVSTTTSSSFEERSWDFTVSDLDPGTHVLVGTWSWAGDINLTATVTITSN